MATLTVDMFLELVDGTVEIKTPDLRGKEFTPSGTGAVMGLQNIGTSAENLDLGDVGTVGWAFFLNNDATNFVEVGYNDTVFKSVLKLKPGEFAAGPLGTNFGTQPQAKADTAACELQYILWEA